MGAAWHRTKTLAWGPKIVCSNPPGTSVSLCGATVLPAVQLVYTAFYLRLLLAWLPSCEFGVVVGRLCTASVPSGAWGRQANQGPYTRLPLGV